MEQWFINDMKKVHYTPTEADLQKIREKGTGAKGGNSRNTADEKKHDYQIIIYDRNNKTVELKDDMRGKYTFKLKDGGNDATCIWSKDGVEQYGNTFDIKPGSDIRAHVSGESVQSVKIPK